MSLLGLWTNSTHGFTVIYGIKYTLGFILIPLLLQEKCPWDSVEMCSITLVELWTNSIHGFTLITLLFPETCPWNSVEMCRMT